MAVIISRFGLYTFDLAALNVIQFLTEEENRGVVSGFQKTLESMFELASYVLAFIYSTPDQFPYICVISWSMTGFAALLFTAFTIHPHRLHNAYQEIGSGDHHV